MLKLIYDLFLLTAIMVFIIDVSGIIDSLDSALQKWMKNPLVHVPKPFSCSLCSTFWSGLLYLLIVGQFNLTGIALVCMYALLTIPINDCMIFLRETLSLIVRSLSKLLHIY